MASLLTHDIVDFWSEPFSKTTIIDSNNNPSKLLMNQLNDSSLLHLSSNCLDLNYKSKRQRLVECKMKSQPEVFDKKSPMLTKYDLLCSALKLSDFNVTYQIGRGSFGIVYAVDLLNNAINNSYKQSKKLAIKVIKFLDNATRNKQVIKSILAEQNLKNLKHQNIISQLGCSQFDESIKTKCAFIIYEYGGKFNLNQFIFDFDKELNIIHRKSFSLDLIKALEYIHSHNIIHMDLKPANVIVTDALQCKLCDFGCSIKLNNNNSKTNFVESRWTGGTWFYRAPELFISDKFQKTSQSEISFKCDIYSLGIVMWQLLSRDSPYHENPHAVIYQIVTRNLRPKFPKKIENLNYSKETEKESRTDYSYSFENCDKKSIANKNDNCIALSKNISFLNPINRLDGPVMNKLNEKNGILSNQKKKELTDISKSEKLQTELLFSTDQNINNNQENDKQKIVNQTNLISNTISKFQNKIFYKEDRNNFEFEKIYRSLIEQCWDKDPEKRFDAKKLKEILTNTKITY